MSIRVMADVWDFGPEDPTDNVVLLWLANRSNDQGGNCFPSRSEIAAKVRHSERTVQRSLGRLEEEGWITVKRGDGRGNFSQYQINVGRLKGRHRDSLLEEKGRQDDTLFPGERETLCPERETYATKPPTPPLIEEPSGNIIKTIPQAVLEGIYQAYPLHVGKQDALKAISKAILKNGHDATWMLERVKLYAAARVGEDKDFTPHPATWFNRGSYDDDESAWRNRNGSRPPQPKPRLLERVKV